MNSKTMVLIGACLASFGVGLLWERDGALPQESMQAVGVW